MASGGCVCTPSEVDGSPYSPFVAEWLGDCAYSHADYASVSLGLLGVALFVTSQLPQLYLNWRNGNADELSHELLLYWLVGDAANLLGCLLTAQLPTQTFTAWYFLILVSPARQGAGRFCVSAMRIIPGCPLHAFPARP